MLVKPIVTEKSMAEVANNRFTFEVVRSSNKSEIKGEVERLFGVKVLSIQTMAIPGKKYRMGKRGLFEHRAKRKKAVVTLAAGQRIDLFDTKRE